MKRFVSIWFRYLKTDWFTRRYPKLKNIPFVLASPHHGRMVITAVNRIAGSQGITEGMVVADARAICPSVEVLDDKPDLAEKALTGLAEWCIRYTPFVAADIPDGLILDASGCTHLWGGDGYYLDDIISRLRQFGYSAKAVVADSVGCAWAVARYESDSCIIDSGKEFEALISLPPAALRLENETVQMLEKLGLRRIGDFVNMPRKALRRRFGERIIERLEQALGNKEEVLYPVCPIEPYQERLPALDPIRTRTGIEIALKNLLTSLCMRLQQEMKGLRKGMFICYRVDGKIETVEIGINHASHKIEHLFKIFELKLSTIEPALGIELFLLVGGLIEDVLPAQVKLWDTHAGVNNKVAELLDTISGKVGTNSIKRFLPYEHHWPERSFKAVESLHEKSSIAWKVNRPRPIEVLEQPERIEVTAPIPDYPPMSFNYKGKYHKVVKADGPERIEQEWWLQEGQHRDYYIVEDEAGCRYWLFRLGHYDAAKSYGWFIHGFFE